MKHFKNLLLCLILLVCFKTAPADSPYIKKIFLLQKPKSKQKILISHSCHTQGIALFKNYLFLSCVDKKEKKAYLYRLKQNSQKNFVLDKKIDLTIYDQYHPSGIDIDNSCLWIAVAQYHPAPARSTVLCLDPELASLKPKFSFNISDHIGAICLIDNLLVALNWDSKDFYILSTSGRVIKRLKNTSAVAYQDCKHFSSNVIICGGKARSRGYIDFLSLNGGLKLIRRIEVKKRSAKGHILTREGLCFKDEMLYLLPDDLPYPTLYSFTFKGIVK